MKITQAERILEVLQKHNGEYVNGRYFVQTMMITQFHTRIFELQKRGHDIKASPFVDDYGFKSYRLMSEALPMPQPEKVQNNKMPSGSISPQSWRSPLKLF